MISTYGVRSENSAQFEEHSLMPRRSNGSPKLNRSKYCIDEDCANDITGSLRPEPRREDPAHFEQAVEIEPLAQQDRNFGYLAKVSRLELVILVG